MKRTIKRMFAMMIALVLCLSMWTLPAIAEDDAHIGRMNAFEARQREKGIWITWSLDELIAWQDCNGLEGQQLLDTAPDSMVTRDEAIAAAHAYLLASGDKLYPNAWTGVREPAEITQDLLNDLSVSAVLAIGTEANADEWYLYLYDPAWIKDGVLDCYYFIVDAHTGEVLNCVAPGGNG